MFQFNNTKGLFTMNQNAKSGLSRSIIMQIVSTALIFCIIFTTTAASSFAATTVSASTKAGYCYTITRETTIPDFWAITTPSATRLTYAKSTIDSRDISGLLSDFKNAVDSLKSAEEKYDKDFAWTVITGVLLLVKLGINPTEVGAKIIAALIPGASFKSICDAFDSYMDVQSKKEACETAYNNINITISR